MKKHHRLVSLASALLLALAALPCTAMAAEAGDTEPAQGAPPPAALYPAEVRTSEENGMIRLEKVYYLSTRDDPSAIPTGDFDREGRHYTLLDVLKNDLSETDSKDYIEVVTLDSSTKDMAEIIKTLEPEREIATEDGYTGILKPDYTKITVEAAGYKNNSWTVSAKRTYPNLSDADASLIPKTITDSGRTLTLAGVDWQEAGEFYNAIASYTGTASGRSVSGCGLSEGLPIPEGPIAAAPSQRSYSSLSASAGRLGQIDFFARNARSPGCPLHSPAAHSGTPEPSETPSAP